MGHDLMLLLAFILGGVTTNLSRLIGLEWKRVIRRNRKL